MNHPTRFKKTPKGQKTARMLEVEANLGTTLEEDWDEYYLSRKWGQKRLANRWGVGRGLIFGQGLAKGRHGWVEMLDLPLRDSGGVESPETVKARDACEVCGTDDVPLETSHWVAAKDGGTRSRENTLRLCPNCHKRLDVVEDPTTVEKAREALLFRECGSFLHSAQARADDAPSRFRVLCEAILNRTGQTDT